MKRIAVILVLASAAVGLWTLGYWVGHRTEPTAGAVATTPATTGKAAGQVLYWYDPMLPQQHFDRPGLSPMGMQMVPEYAGDGAEKDVVRIDPTVRQNLGMRTAAVERRVLRRVLTVPGTISWNLRQATIISARVDATVARLHVRAPYTQVAAGAPLADVLAPQWSSALAEYAALQQAQSPDARALRAAARERLQVLGLNDADLRAARRRGGALITLHAPQAGVITTLDVREGQRVGAGQTLMTLNGLATVWVEAALPQAGASAVHAGTPATVTVDALPGRAFDGVVDALLPDIDSVTRTQRARIVLDNADGALHPGMFATVQLHPAQGTAVPVVPDAALIASGQQARVIVAEGDGRLRPVAVRTGASSAGYTEILGGLQGGEQVVVSGQFLIDSEASLSGALERLDADHAMPAPASSSAAAPERTPDHSAYGAMPMERQP